MAFEQKQNTGALFKNDKATSKDHPQARGDALIDGIPYWVSAWTNIDQKGNRYQKLKFERKEEKRQARQVSEPRQQERELDDEVPF